MTLDELFGTDRADALVPSFPYLVVEVDEAILRAANHDLVGLNALVCAY